MTMNCTMPVRRFPLNQALGNHKANNPFVKNIHGSIFTLGTFEDMIRVQIGRQDPSRLRPCRCFALRPQPQPVIDETIWNDGSIPSLAYQNFRWCGVLSNVIPFFNDRYHIPGFEQESKSNYPNRLFFIDLLYDEDVYVVDVNAGKRYLDKISSSINQTFKSKFDFEESRRVIARTIMPFKFYVGQFAEPTIIIKRVLLFDEVRYIKSFSRR